MTEPKKSDHWNSLLDQIGVPAAQPATAPPPADAPTGPEPSPAAATRPSSPSRERPRPRAEPKAAPPPARPRSAWNSVLGALGLAPAEEPTPPAAKSPPEKPIASDRTPVAESPASAESVRNPLDEIRPRYKPEEAPFPASRRQRDLVDDVAPDIDLDADFGLEPDVDIPPPASDEGEVEKAIERDVPRGEREPERERTGRPRRRRRRGGRRDEGAQTPVPERRVERPATESESEPELDLDLEAEPEEDFPAIGAEQEPLSEEPSAPADAPREGVRRRRRRRRRGSRDREGPATAPSAESPPPRRRPRDDEEQTTRAQHRPQPEEVDLDDDLEDVEAELEQEGDEAGGEHAVHKKIPTWAETVGILIDANMAARSSRQPDRGRPRRPRRDR